MTINELLCAIEDHKVELSPDNFEIYTMRDPDALLPLYLFEDDGLHPITSGKLEDVYQFIYQEEYGDYNAVFVRQYDDAIKIFITYKDYDRDVIWCRRLVFQ